MDSYLTSCALSRLRAAPSCAPAASILRNGGSFFGSILKCMSGESTAAARHISGKLSVRNERPELSTPKADENSAADDTAPPRSLSENSPTISAETANTGAMPPPAAIPQHTPTAIPYAVPPAYAK